MVIRGTAVFGSFFSVLSCGCTLSLLSHLVLDLQSFCQKPELPGMVFVLTFAMQAWWFG